MRKRISAKDAWRFYHHPTTEPAQRRTESRTEIYGKSVFGSLEQPTRAHVGMAVHFPRRLAGVLLLRHERVVRVPVASVAGLGFRRRLGPGRNLRISRKSSEQIQPTQLQLRQMRAD